MLRFGGNKALAASGRRGGIRKLTYCKQDEVLLVVLAHAVIDPGTVVVHLPNAPLTNTEKAQRQTFKAVLASWGSAARVWRGAWEAALGPAESVIAARGTVPHGQGLRPCSP